MKTTKCWYCGVAIDPDSPQFDINGEPVAPQESEHTMRFCSTDCAHECRCEAREAADFEDRAYGRD